jgi:hypothetical protein
VPDLLDIRLNLLVQGGTTTLHQRFRERRSQRCDVWVRTDPLTLQRS